MLRCLCTTKVTVGPDLSHEQAILINLSVAIVGSCPGDSNVVPGAITF